MGTPIGGLGGDGGLEGWCGELELLAAVFVGEGREVGAAAGFVEAGGAYDDEFLRLAEALGVDGRLAADHADGGELGDLVGEGHEVGDGAKGFVGEGGVEAGHEDALAEGDQFEGQRDDRGGEELDFVDTDDFDFGELREEALAEVFYVGDGGGFVGVRTVRGDGGAVVAEVDVGLEAGHALAGDAGSLEATDELFGFAREHGAGDDFENAGDGDGLLHGGLCAAFEGWVMLWIS